MATPREGTAQPIPDEGQHLYRVVVERNNMTLGSRVRQSGEAFLASELDPQIFRLVRDGLVNGARLEELSSGRLPPLQIADVVAGFRDDGSPIMIPGDRRANRGLTFSVHGNVKPAQDRRVELYQAQMRTVEQETAQRLAEEQGLQAADFGDDLGVDPLSVHQQLSGMGYESIKAAEEAEEAEQFLLGEGIISEESGDADANSGQAAATGTIPEPTGTSANPLLVTPGDTQAAQPGRKARGANAQKQQGEGSGEGSGSEEE